MSLKTNIINIPIHNISFHGGTRILIELAKILIERGQDVKIFTSCKRNNSIFSIDQRIQLIEIGVYTGIKAIDYLVFWLILPFYLREGISIAGFFPNYFSVKLSKFLWHKKYVYFVQDIESKYQNILFGKILNYLCDITYRCDMIVTSNDFLKNELKNRYKIDVRLSINIGPNEIFYKKSHEKNKKKYDIIYFLRSNYWKRVDRFERILLRLKSKHSFLCVSQETNLFKKYENLGCTCIQPKDDNEIIYLLDISKVLLMTSSYEGFGLPPLEAMSRGVPSIVFESGGPSLYIKNEENSFIVKNEEEAITTIKRILSDSKLYIEISKRAKITSKRYSQNKNLINFAEFIISLNIAKH